MELKKAKQCEECNGIGEVSTMEIVWPNEPHIADIGTEKCANCFGTGEEPDEAIVVERIIEDLDVDQENKLQEYFVGLNEFSGILIIKDNCEDLFENWLGSVSLKTLEKVLYGRV